MASPPFGNLFKFESIEFKNLLMKTLEQKFPNLLDVPDEPIFKNLEEEIDLGDLEVH